MTTKDIKVGGDSPYRINYSPEVGMKILDYVVEWMEQKDHWAAYSGEAICQDDNCQIDAPGLLGDIMDDILKPDSLVDDDGF